MFSIKNPLGIIAILKNKPKVVFPFHASQIQNFFNQEKSFHPILYIFLIIESLLVPLHSFGIAIAFFNYFLSSEHKTTRNLARTLNLKKYKKSYLRNMRI